MLNNEISSNHKYYIGLRMDFEVKRKLRIIQDF